MILVEDQYERDAVWNGQVRCRASNVPDPAFAWLDQNYDGVLSTREIEQATDRLAVGSLPLHPERIPETVMMHIQRGSPQEVSNDFGSPQIMQQANSSQAPAWFQDLDSNRDGEIAQDEFLGSLDQFHTIDLNHDQFLTPQEFSVVQETVE